LEMCQHTQTFDQDTICCSNDSELRMDTLNVNNQWLLTNISECPP